MLTDEELIEYLIDKGDIESLEFFLRITVTLAVRQTVAGDFRVCLND